MDKVGNTITGVLVWAAVLQWAERSHQAEWHRMLQATQGGGRHNLALQMDPPAMFAAQTYLIAMALKQMKKRVAWLQGSRALPDDAGPAVTEFLTLYRSEELKDLRDVLAHAHDYTVGKGCKPELVVNPDTDTWAAGVFITADRVSELRMFGKSYRVREVIDAAQRVAEVLRPG